MAHFTVWAQKHSQLSGVRSRQSKICQEPFGGFFSTGLTLFGVKAPEAAVSPRVRVVRGKHKRKAATRRGAKKGIKGRLKLSKAFISAQNGDEAAV